MKYENELHEDLFDLIIIEAIWSDISQLLSEGEFNYIRDLSQVNFIRELIGDEPAPVKYERWLGEEDFKYIHCGWSGEFDMHIKENHHFKHKINIEVE